ncbi:MAG TPA: formate dehydrogenase subunit gamma [Thermodesulfovibrionales bacterium]|nr:formate dehydrogenase subunit gamma [Thermodesulfovibrionales bacterium]
MSNMIKKANSFEILNHWVMVASCLVLTVSGFGFLFKLEQIGAVFGGFNQMKVIHNWAGVVFTVSFFITIFHYLPVALKFTSDDVTWVAKLGGYLSKKAVLPPQDELNAGQKVFYIILFLSSVAMAGSGFVIWLRPEMQDMGKWILLSHLIHNISFDVMLIFIPAHIYMGSLANPGTFRIMVYGTVPVDWARKRHAKWVQKMNA